MKTYGIGLIIVLIAYAVSIYPAYINYNFIVNPPNYQNQAEYMVRYEELKTASLIGFITTFLAILGLLIFLVEFIKHAHSHEHDVSMPRVSPPSP